MNVLISCVVVFFLNLPFVLADEAKLSALQWLERMSQAMKSENYQGTVVFMKNGMLDTMKYKHTVINGQEQERLISLNSPFREVVRKTNEVSCLYKETSEKVINHHPIESSFLINLPTDFSQLNSVYEFTVQGEEAIAMLPAEIISIQSKDHYRYHRKVWIEKEHFLPIKAEVYDLDGSILEQWLFTELKIDKEAQENAVEINDAKLQIKHIHTSQAEPFENAAFKLKNWPVGFKVMFFIRNSLQQSQKAVDHLLMSDGFSSVSVYLESKESQTVEGLHSLGSVNAFSRVVDNYQITVLGEVPAKTVELVGTGITLH